MEVLKKWQNLFKSASHVTNVKIVTKDRKVKHTHKLFLVSISDTFKDLLWDQMETDGTVIIFPDATLEDIEIKLEELLLGSVDSFDQNSIDDPAVGGFSIIPSSNIISSNSMGVEEPTNDITKCANQNDYVCSEKEQFDDVETKPKLSNRKNLTLTGSKQSKKEKYDEALQAYFRFG